MTKVVGQSLIALLRDEQKPYALFMGKQIKFAVLSAPRSTEMGETLWLTSARFDTATDALAYRSTVDGPSKVVAVRA